MRSDWIYGTLGFFALGDNADDSHPYLQAISREISNILATLDVGVYSLKNPEHGEHIGRNQAERVQV